MADKKSSSLGVACPYWSINDNEECGMSKGGVYIPLPQHMKMFCLTSQYIQCHHYIKGCESIRIQKENRKKETVVTDERRKLRRFREELHLLLAVCDTRRKPPEIISFKARTIDVSLGGMRLESPEKVAAGSIVGFEMVEEFSGRGISGVGEVRWCRAQPDTDKFEFGIAFPDFNATPGMREHLRM
jgi:hypothetical protein